MTAQPSVGGRSLPVYGPAGRPVGAIRNGVLRKSGLDPAIHKLERPAGWATQTDHLRQLREAGGTQVEFRTVTGDVWRSRLRDWEEHGVPLDRGYGAQAVLPDKWGKVNGRPAPEPSRLDEARVVAKPPSANLQLRLALDG